MTIELVASANRRRKGTIEITSSGGTSGRIDFTPGPSLEARADPGVLARIERTPGVVGGRARIAGTRIPVWLLVQYRELGWSDQAMLDNYPSLQRIDLHAAWMYAALHGDEIAREIELNDDA